MKRSTIVFSHPDSNREGMYVRSPIRPLKKIKNIRMKVNILILFCLALGFASCANNKNHDAETPAAEAAKVYMPVQLNETIMALENSLEEPMLKAEAEIKVRSSNANMAGVAQSAKAMEDSIQLRLDAAKNLSPVGVGGEDFKVVSVRYFEFLKSIYTTYREIAEAKDDNIKMEKAKQMESLMNSQAGVMATLQQAQQKYATDNGFVY